MQAVTINISELRQNIQHFVARANAGERIGVKVRGKVVAELAPAMNAQEEAKRKLTELRKTAVIGDVITPEPFDWDDWEANILPQPKAEARKRKP